MITSTPSIQYFRVKDSVIAAEMKHWGRSNFALQFHRSSFGIGIAKLNLHLKTHVVIELFLEINLGIDSRAAEGGSGKE